MKYSITLLDTSFKKFKKNVRKWASVNNNDYIRFEDEHIELAHDYDDQTRKIVHEYKIWG